MMKVIARSPVCAGTALHCRNKPQSGFTLLELLIALSLTAVLLTLLSAGMFTVMRDWDDNHSALERRLEYSISLLQIERALEGAFPHSYQDPDTLERRVYFQGEPDRLRWVSTVSPQRAEGLVAWELGEETGNRSIFSLRLTPALTNNPEARLQQSQPRPLIEGYEPRFRYLYETPDGDRRWIEEWDGAVIQGLPMAVHLRLEPLDRDRETLEVMAPIRAHDHRMIPRNPLAEG